MGLSDIWTEIKRWGVFFGCYDHLLNIRLWSKQKKLLMEVPVLRNDCYINTKCEYDFPLAMVFVSPLKFMEHEHAIYVNSTFLKVFTPEEQWAAYMHEMGHLYYKHLQQEQQPRLDHELEADRFACNRGCGESLIQSLLKYRDLVHAQVPPEEQIDWLYIIGQRVKAIKQYLEE